MVYQQYLLCCWCTPSRDNLSFHAADNIWFRHSHEHSPVCRPTSDLSSTLDQYDFSDDQDIEGEEEEDDDGEIDEEPRQRPKNKYL